MQDWKVLIIDQLDQPIKMVDWTTAIIMLLQNKIDVVYEYQNVLIRSEKIQINLPSVIRLKRYFRRPSSAKFSRYSVYFRDKWTCQYCGEKKKQKELTFDHVIPRSLGGKTNWENIVTACFRCNGKKADLSLQESGMSLLNKPKKPHWTPCIIFKIKKHHPEEWKYYIHWYDQIEENI
jgi:5-methylcytosine-specific restriction endonuclease McrA